MGQFENISYNSEFHAQSNHQVTSFFNISDIGLYRDDGLAILKATSGSEAERIKKKNCKSFQESGTPRNNPDEPQNRRLPGCYIQFAKRHLLPIQEAERHPVLRKQVIKSPTNYFTKYTGCNQQTCSKHILK